MHSTIRNGNYRLHGQTVNGFTMKHGINGKKLCFVDHAIDFMKRRYYWSQTKKQHNCILR